MISSTLLTLIVIPAIFGLVKGFRLPSGDRSTPQPPVQRKEAVTRVRIPEPVE
jgi:Cu(I)/Ag(I) efflux system membrane protein CusA/SilA